MRLMASALVAACCARADALWTQRADGQENGRPRPERASAAVAAYEQA